MSSYPELLSRIEAPQGGREVFDPATEELIGAAPRSTVDDVDAAVATARAAQPGWAALSHAERSAALMACADAVQENAETLAELLSREQGKPLNGLNARFEVGACVGWLQATAATPLEPEVLIDDGTEYAELHYRPLGVVGAIGPWNWPMMITIWQVAPSLRMGNAVVVKPSENTTLSVLGLLDVLNHALPEGVLTAVTGEGDIGAALAAHPGVDKVMFTGSVETGKRIIASSADTVKRVTVELGGNDAGIVLPDADPATIAEGVFWGAFINTGQTCAALKRLYVHDSMYDAMCQALVAYAKNVPMGVGLDEANALGPLQNKEQYDIVTRLVGAARDSGARVLLGGDPDPAAKGYFYPTTLVADIDNGNPLVTEEQFGPALPIVRYHDIEQAIDMANGLDVGLGASVWSADRARAREVASRLRAGTVWINKHGAIHPMIPFGGASQSGYGLEFGVEGLKHVAQPVVING
ncbi:MAG: aldehyde dehydrogenase family protein [Dermatophilaceae bacterium]